MGSMNVSHYGDRNGPVDWLAELDEALRDPALVAFDEPGGQVSAEARQAAYMLAVALGRCRVFGVPMAPEEEGTLPAAEAAAAADRAAELVAMWTDAASELGSRWDEAEPEEGEALCAEMLEARMDACFVMEAVSEAYEDMLEAPSSEPQLPALEAAIDRLVERIEAFDQVLQSPENLALLSTLRGLPLLDNWRTLLAGHYREVLPWWLDGTLEATAEQIEQVVAASLPRGEAWQRAAQRAREKAAVRVRRHGAEELLGIPPTYAAAAATPSAVPPVSGFLKWTSPDGRWMARLSIPSQAAPDAVIPVEFLTADGSDAAMELAGQPARLAGVESQIDAGAILRLDLAQLQKALQEPGAELVLEVGAPPQEWQAEQGNPPDAQASSGT